MQRSIKFRAWFPKAKRMLHFDEVIMDDEYDRLAICLVDSDAVQQYSHLAGGSYLPDESFELMQYTGLHDKQGVEIFERDIVKVGDINHWVWQGVVEMNQGCWVVRINDSQTPILAKFVTEVIGNIWEGLYSGEKWH